MELALVLPVLLLVLFGAVEFGRAWNNKNDAVHIAHEAVRMASVDQVDCPTLRADASASGLPGSTTIAMTLPTGNGGIGDPVSASVTVPFSSSVPIVSNILAAAGLDSLTGTATMRLEQRYAGGTC